MMNNGDFGFMGMHFAWWVLIFVLVFVIIGFFFRSRRRE